MSSGAPRTTFPDLSRMHSICCEFTLTRMCGVASIISIDSMSTSPTSRILESTVYPSRLSLEKSSCSSAFCTLSMEKSLAHMPASVRLSSARKLRSTVPTSLRSRLRNSTVSKEGSYVRMCWMHVAASVTVPMPSSLSCT